MDKIIIIYTSKHGAAKKCAQILLEKLNGKVALYDLKQQGSDVDLAAYEKIIIGGSIYAGKLDSDLKDFCQKNLQEVKNKRIGFFISCMRSGDAALKELNDAFPLELLEKADAKDFFGGEIRYQRLNLMEKIMIKIVSMSNKSFPAFDKDGNISTILKEKISKFADLINDTKTNNYSVTKVK